MSRLNELNAKIDGFFARVEARHGDDMQCKTGCSDCCQPGLTVTRLEADAIAAYAQGKQLALGAREDRCVALDGDGRCTIYDVRPVVCRSHGVPVRMRDGSLPVIRSCHRNFTQTEAAADCVLDQQTLSALVLAVNAGNSERIDLATLLRAVLDMAASDG